MGIGKWIGGVLGFMAFGPLGALAGIILGSFFEEGANMTGQSFGGGTNYDDEYIRRDPYAGERNSFLFSMLVMASYIIRADGKIMHSEMEYVRQFLRRNFGEIAVSQGEEILLKLFDQAKRMALLRSKRRKSGVFSALAGARFGVPSLLSPATTLISPVFSSRTTSTSCSSLFFFCTIIVNF